MGEIFLYTFNSSHTSNKVMGAHLCVTFQNQSRVDTLPGAIQFIFCCSTRRMQFAALNTFDATSPQTDDNFHQAHGDSIVGMFQNRGI